MQSNKLEVLTETEEILNSFDNNLDFKLVKEESSLEFNILDENNRGYRLCYDFLSKEIQKLSLTDHSDISEDVHATAMCIDDPGTYIFISNNPMDIPILYAHNINHIFCDDDAELINYTDEINSAPLILTDKSQESIAAIHDMFDIETPIVYVDFSELCETYNIGDSLLELSAKLQETGEQGFSPVNTFLYTESKKYTDTTNDKEQANEELNLNESIDTTESVVANTTVEQIESPVNMNNLAILSISKLKADQKYQSRASEDSVAIQDLAQAYADGEDIPPIDVVKVDTEEYIIVDGHHRFAAAKEASIENVSCHITEGTEHDAFVLSLSANANNKALKRTNADKRKAVITALDCEEFDEYSNREIASLCKVSSTLVDKIVRERQNNDDNNLTTANVCTPEKIAESKEDTDHDTSVHLTNSEEAEIPSASTPRTKSGVFKESLGNAYISLSVTLKNEPKDEETVQGLLTDLEGVISAYENDFKEAI